MRVPSVAGVALLIGVVGVGPAWTAGQAALVGELLRLATDQVERLHEDLSAVVAEEEYEQRASTAAGRFRGGGGLERRTLRSDFLLVRPDGEDRHYGFRDVFEVDGRPVRDREARLATLFLDSAATRQRQIRGILAESARYNIGDVERTINTPTLALLFLRTDYKTRFVFESGGGNPPLGLDRPDRDLEVAVVEYEETWPTTLVRGTDGRNMPASGRYWIESASGRVLATELAFDTASLEVTVAVRYAEDPVLGHLVPIEMRERYDDRQLGSTVEGTARYAGFRRFRVEVEER